MQIAAHSATRSLYDTLPTAVFVRLDSLVTFSLSNPEVLLKTRAPVDGVDLNSTEILVTLPFGRLFAMQCGGVTVGYRFSMTTCRSIEVRRALVKFQRKAKVTAANATKYLTNNDLFVYGNTDALIAVTRASKWLGDIE